MKAVLPTPTTAELVILQMLWREGPSTVHSVHECVYENTGVGYTSALKLLQNMLTKGLVTRTEASRQHIYAAAVTQRSTMNKIVRKFIDSSFAGLSAALAMQALEAKPPKPAELGRLKELIRELERKEEKP